MMDNFVKTLIEEVKSQGVFDEFRFNCCLADVDTKPAYQNVRNRVETAVNDFLAKQHWTPDTNKVQLRERLRKHLLDSDVLDKGVDHIVDQVVNPKVATIFEPKIESIAYKYLGITPPPPPTNPPPRPPLLPAPPLPPYPGHTLGHMNGDNMLKVETTASLLPTDLEQISPDSDRATFKSYMKDDELPPGVDDDDMDYDETTSPAFEPAADIKEEINNSSLNTSDSNKDVKELANDSRDAGASQTSQLSQVSSDSRLTIASTDAPQQTSANNSVELSSNIAANMSEEAQMPKFNENSSETNENSGRQLHFDIKQDAITFEGTERRNSLSENTNGDGQHALSIEDAIMSEVKSNIDNVNSVTIETKPDSAPEPVSIKTEQEPENNFSLFSHSTPNSQNPKDSLTATLQVSDLTEVPEIKQELTKPDEAKAIEPKPEVVSSTLPTATEELKDDTIKSPASASSSSQTKKHSHSREKDKDKRHHSQSRCDDKHRRKSRERERDRDREHDKSRSKTSSSSKPSSSSHSSSSKHRSSTSKYDKSSTSTTSSRSNHESSASKRSSSRHDSSTHKKHKSSSSSSRSDRDRTKSRESRESHSQSHSHSHHSRSHNGSGTSKRSDRDRDRDRNKSSSSSTSNPATNSINQTATAVIQDDHNEIKAKLQKRHSNDSNDEGKPPGASGKSPTEPAESQAKEKTDTSVQNGKASESNGTNGTNGTNGSNDNQTQSNNESVEEATVDASNVIIVTDILQQSSASFIELSSVSAAKKLAEVKARETNSKSELQATDSVDTEPESMSTEAEITTATDAANEPVEDAVIKSDPVVASVMKPDTSAETESVKNISKESIADPSMDVDSREAIVADAAPNLEPIQESTSVEEIPSQQSLQESEETFTHFEENAEEFNARLKLIEVNIKDRRLLLNVFSAIEDTSIPRRNSAKRRLSSEASSSKQHSSSSFSSSLGSPNEKVKRTRREVAKTSPTPSEISVNSKENEEQEKHEKGS